MSLIWHVRFLCDANWQIAGNFYFRAPKKSSTAAVLELLDAYLTKIRFVPSFMSKETFYLRLSISAVVDSRHQLIIVEMKGCQGSSFRGKKLVPAKSLSMWVRNQKVMTTLGVAFVSAVTLLGGYKLGWKVATERAERKAEEEARQRKLEEVQEQARSEGLRQITEQMERQEEEKQKREEEQPQESHERKKEEAAEPSQMKAEREKRQKEEEEKKATEQNKRQEEDLGKKTEERKRQELQQKKTEEEQKRKQEQETKQREEERLRVECEARSQKLTSELGELHRVAQLINAAMEGGPTRRPFPEPEKQRVTRLLQFSTEIFEEGFPVKLRPEPKPTACTEVSTWLEQIQKYKKESQQDIQAIRTYFENEIAGQLRVVVKLQFFGTEDKAPAVERTKSCVRLSSSDWLGPFYAVYPPKFTNSDVFNGASNLIGIQGFFDQILEGQSNVLFGYGHSGSGKTCSLFGGDKCGSGLLQLGLQRFFDKTPKPEITLLYAFELYGQITLSEGKPAVLASIFIHRAPKQDTNFETAMESFTCKGRRYLHPANWLSKLQPGATQNSVSLKKVEDFEAILTGIETVRKEHFRIKPTPNNPGGSSRSHLFLVFKIKGESKTGYLTVVDMAGVEDPRALFAEFFTGDNPAKIFSSLGQSNPNMQHAFTKKAKEFFETHKQATADFLKFTVHQKPAQKPAPISTHANPIYLTEIFKEGFFINETLHHLTHVLRQGKAPTEKGTQTTLFSSWEAYTPKVFWFEAGSELPREKRIEEKGKLKTHQGPKQPENAPPTKEKNTCRDAIGMVTILNFITMLGEGNSKYIMLALVPLADRAAAEQTLEYANESLLATWTLAERQDLCQRSSQT